MTINHSPRKEKKHMTEIIISCFKKREKKREKSQAVFFQGHASRFAGNSSLNMCKLQYYQTFHIYDII